jgi:multidrug efflux pump subunit AcrB
MWMTRVSIKHPVFATMVMVGLMVLGLFSYRGLGVESMPNIEIPAVWIETQYPGASPEQVENDVTRPIEEAANTVGGIKTIRSNSWEGHSGVGVEFQLATDMDRAVQDLRDKHRHRARRLPARGQGTRRLPPGRRERAAGAAVSLTSHERSLRDLSMLAEQVIVKRMQAVAGVGQVRINGKQARQVLVDIRPDQLRSLNVGIDEVMPRSPPPTPISRPAASAAASARTWCASKAR